MKWIGQHIYDLISRFRNDVYLEDLSTTTETNVLVVDSDGKVSKTTVITGDVTGVTAGSNITVTDVHGPVPTVALNTSLTGLTSVTSTNFVGALTGNAKTATKIGTITNSDIVQLTTFQILTNKTFSGGATFRGSTSGGTNVIATAVAGLTTLTLPAATDTLVGANTIDTLTNKTLTAPTITGAGAIAGVFTGNITGDVTGVVQVAAQTVIDHDQLANFTADEHFTQANITTVGTIGTGVWNGTAIATDYLKHKSTFELAGYAVADGTNYMMADIMSGNKAPFLHDETSIGANGTTADNPAIFLRAAGTVMPYDGTLKIWKGWGASSGTPTVDIGIFKYSPTADDATSDSLVLVKNTQITGAGNDNLKAFSETSFSVTVTAGDILITAIKGSADTDTAYFTSTVEIEWTS
jgi:hypothetical protein